MPLTDVRHPVVSTGFLYFTGNALDRDVMEAHRWALKASMQGNAHSQECLAIIYGQGIGVARNIVEALAWASIAAESGDADIKQGYVNLVSQAAAEDVKSAVIRASELKRQIAESLRNSNTPPAP